MNLNKFLKQIGDYVNGRDLILHTDMGIILEEFPALLEKNKSKILKNFCEILIDKINARSIFIPTFNYDFLENGIYDVNNDIGQVGVLSEFVRKEYNDFRSHIPVFNHIDIKRIYSNKEINRNYFKAFGKDSFYDEFQSNKGIICFWGCKLSNSNTFL